MLHICTNYFKDEASHFTNKPKLITLLALLKGSLELFDCTLVLKNFLNRTI